MGKPKVRFVAKAESGQGWRIWDRTVKRWWGNPYEHYPDQLLTELNGAKRPDQLRELGRSMPPKRNG
jgi:hypothetical protein